VASDFDLDGKTDVAVASSFDSVFVLYNSGNLPTGIKDPVRSGIPAEFRLGQNYPNPFNPSTVISFQLPVRSHVMLSVYNLLGQEVTTLIDDMQDAGYRSAVWNANNSPSGVYYYRIQAGSYMEVRKMILLK
jgi:hypothetical protein